MVRPFLRESFPEVFPVSNPDGTDPSTIATNGGSLTYPLHAEPAQSRLGKNTQADDFIVRFHGMRRRRENMLSQRQVPYTYLMLSTGYSAPFQAKIPPG